MSKQKKVVQTQVLDVTISKNFWSSYAGIAITGGLFSALVLYARWFTIQPEEFFWNNNYIRIANNPFAGEGSPWGFRLLTPLCVYYLPISIPTGFKVINLLMLFLTGTVLIEIGKTVGLRGYLPYLAAIPYLLSAGVNWQLKEIWFTDAMSHFFLGLTILSFLKNRDDWVACLSMIGTFNRFSSLFFLPIWYLVRFGWRMNIRSLVRLAVVWSPSLFVLFLIHQVWFPLTSFSLTRGLANLADPGFWKFYIFDFMRTTPSVQELIGRLVSFQLANDFFGSLLPLFLLHLFWCKSYQRRLAAFCLVIWLQFVLARDVGRLETYAFPILIPQALYCFQLLTKDWRHYGITDVALGGILLIFPHSIIAGIIILAATIAMRCWFAGEIQWYQIFTKPAAAFLSANQELNPSGNDDKLLIGNCYSHSAFFVMVICLLLTITFIGYTYVLRPEPLLCFPPSLVSTTQSTWKLGFIKGVNLQYETIQLQSYPAAANIGIGDKENYSESVAIPIEKPSCRFILLSLSGYSERGNQIILRLGNLKNNAFNNLGSSNIILDPAEAKGQFVRNITFTPPDGVNTLFIGHKNTWCGLIRFILYDSTRLISKAKTLEAIPAPGDMAK